MGASIEEHTRMHGFGLYPLVDVRDSSVALCVGKDRCKAVAAIVTIQRATFPRVWAAGQELPPEQTTVIPFKMAWNAAVALLIDK